MPLKDIPTELLNHPDTAKAAVEAQNINDTNRHKSGFMGSCFGIGENATINYVGFILLLIVVSLLAMGVLDFLGFVKGERDISKYTDVWIPIVTSIIGFLIGRKSSFNGD
jgi:hypothetical protein